MIKTKSTSLKTKVTYLLILIVLSQGALSFLSSFLSGVFDNPKINNYDTFVSTIVQRSNNISRTLNRFEMNTILNSNVLNEKINRILLDNVVGIKEVLQNEETSQKVFEVSFENINNLISSNNITGAFVIFNDKFSGLEGKASFPAVYVKDTKPKIAIGGTEDYLIESGPIFLKNKYGMPTSSNWSRDYTFFDEDRSFFDVPIEMFEKENTTNISKLGYWSSPFISLNDNTEVLTFTLPLIDKESNTVYAVYGLEISVSYFVESILYHEQTPFESYFLIFGKKDSYKDYVRTFITNERKNSIVFDNNYVKIEDYYIRKNRHLKKILFEEGQEEYLIYEGVVEGLSNEFFTMGFIRKDEFLATTISQTKFIIFALLIAQTISIIFIFVITNIIMVPLQKLNNEIDESQYNNKVKFTKTNVMEFDKLTISIEKFLENSADAELRIARILELCKIPIGFFEENDEIGQIFVTGSFLEILEIKANPEEVEFLNKEEFYKIYHRLIENPVKEENEIYYYTDSAQAKWIRVETIYIKNRKLGVIVDSTDEITQRKKYEYELEHDLMTKLYNRKAFLRKAYDMIKEDAEKLGIMIFADLDNLKFLNDKYGHETGDKYIKEAAVMFAKFKIIGGIVARISGDEFAIYLHGFNDKEQARKDTIDFINENINGSILTIDNKVRRIRNSMGLAWYPDDSMQVDVLIKYADFAMYEVKNTIKGSLLEFDKESYMKNAHLLEKRESINKLIDENLVRYVFQPVIDVENEEVFAYEALMRPTHPEFTSPIEVISVASAQSKLYQIEKLTIFNVSSWIKENIYRLGSKKIFINTLANQILNEEDTLELIKNYKEIFGNVIFEITENEHSYKEFMSNKIRVFRERFGGGVAIDDFGSGYSNELRMIQIYPDVIKIDQGLIHGIANDVDKRMIVSGLITYCKQRNIKVLAEGVETEEDLETCIELGAELIQGYFFGKPSKELILLSKEKRDVIAKIKKNLL